MKRARTNEDDDEASTNSNKLARSCMRENVFDFLPRDVICYMLQFIPPSHLFGSVSLCCKDLNDCVQAPSTWHNVSMSVTVEALSNHVPACRQVFGRCKLSELQLTSTFKSHKRTTMQQQPVSAVFETLSGSLCSLRLHQVANFGFVDMLSILRSCRSIKSLVLSHTAFTNNQVTLFQLPELSLEHLVLEHVNSAQSNWLEIVLEKSNRNLRSFSFVSSAFNDEFSEYALKLTNHSLSALFTHCVNLEKLNLQYCDSITDDAFIPLIPMTDDDHKNGVANLHAIQIVCCPCVTEGLIYILSASPSSKSLRELNFEMVADSYSPSDPFFIDQPLQPFLELDSLQVDTKILSIMLYNRMLEVNAMNPAVDIRHVTKIAITDEFSSGRDIGMISDLLSLPQFAMINSIAIQSKGIPTVLDSLRKYPCSHSVSMLNLRGNGVTLGPIDNSLYGAFPACKEVKLQNFTINQEPTIRRILIAAPQTESLVIEDCYAEDEELENDVADKSWTRTEAFGSLQRLKLQQNSPCINALAIIMSFTLCFSLRSLMMDGCTIPVFATFLRLCLRPCITALSFTHTQATLRTWLMMLLLCPNTKKFEFKDCKITDEFMISGRNKLVSRAKMLAHIGLITHEIINNNLLIPSMFRHDFSSKFARDVISPDGLIGLLPARGYGLSFRQLFQHLRLLEER